MAKAESIHVCEWPLRGSGPLCASQMPDSEQSHSVCPTCAEADKVEIARLRARVSELEDTILLDKAEEAIARSYGRNGHACRVEEEIRARRGAEWNGAVVEGADRI